MAEKKKFPIGAALTIDAGFERARFVAGRAVPAEWLSSWRNIISLLVAMVREQGEPLSNDARKLLTETLITMDKQLKESGGGF